MATDCVGPLAAERSFGRADISAAQDHFEGRFMGDHMSSDLLIQQASNLFAAINECQKIEAVQYYTRDKERKIIKCSSRSSREIRQLIQGLGANVNKRERKGRTRARSIALASSSDAYGERGVDEPDNPHHSSDNSDASSPGSDTKRKRPEADDSVSAPFKERRRRRIFSLQEIPNPSISEELGSDEPAVFMLRVGDEEAVHEFIVRRFKDLQQNLCKAIAKPWIKIINPNKQTANPYAGGAAKAPWWWPQRPPPGTVPTLRNGFVRHKEPDHLKIQERLILLPHILHLVIDPPVGEKANEIRKISLKEFRRMTFEQLSDKLNDTNYDKKQVLDEIFRAALHLQRYKRGLIDAEFRFSVYNRARTRRGSIDDSYDIKSECDSLDEELNEEFKQQPSFPATHMPLIVLPNPDNQIQHSLPDRAFDLDANRTPLGPRDLRTPSFHPQATTSDLPYGPSYNSGQMNNQDVYPSRIPGGYPPLTLQEPRRYQAPPPHWYLNSSQYAPVSSHLMHSSTIPCHGFSSTVNVPLPPGGVYLPSLSQTTMCIPPLDGFHESTELPRVCEGSRSISKECEDGRGDTLRLPHRPHIFPEYLHNLSFAANMTKQESGGN